jgi:hypothetical protein
VAIPVAVTGGPQTFAFADLPVAVTLDGSGSYDPDADPISAYLWTVVEIPAGSAAVLDDDAIVAPSFTADLPGTYLFLLQVTAGGEDSETSALEAPASAYCAVTVTTEVLALGIPATGERAWNAKVQNAMAALDALAGDLVAHAADTALHPPKATEAIYGKVALSAAPVLNTPVAVGTRDVNWLTLISGGNADPLHTHAGLGGGAGRHHDLRPDLLVGAKDLTWTAGQIAALGRSQNTGGSRQAFAAAENADGILQVDIEKANNADIAGVIWNAPAGDWEAIIDIRIGFNGTLLAQDAEQTLEAGFGWMPDAALGVPSHMLGAGLCISNWSLRAADFGITDPNGVGTTTDWNAGIGAMTPVVRTGLLVTEFLVKLRRVAADTWADISVGGGGYVQIGHWSVVNAAGKFCLFGQLKRAAVGLKLKSTGFRLKAADKWFGA